MFSNSGSNSFLILGISVRLPETEDLVLKAASFSILLIMSFNLYNLNCSFLGSLTISTGSLDHLPFS
jgi:hypothetical protein